MEPASSLIKRFGVDKISKWAGVSRVSCYRWTYPKEKGGTGGQIPQRHWTTIIEGAKADGHAVTHSDFLPRLEAA